MDIEKNNQPVVEKPVRLTKKGLPDRRGETSRKNLEKGKSIIKQALKEIKVKKEVPLKVIEKEEEYSSDNYSTDEEEVELKEQSVISPQIPQIPQQKEETPLPSTYEFTFEKKLNEQIEKLNNDYNLKITNIEKKTKEELEYLKKTNQELKKHLTSNFRTHQGILNQEMYLKF